MNQNKDPDTLSVAIWRGKDRETGQLYNYTVERRANQTVLDIVVAIQREQEQSLAYRYACRVGVCGSCAMTVNGVPRWTCRTHVQRVIEGTDDGVITIEPLRHLPVIKDLACDMEPFFQKWQTSGGRFQGESSRHDPLPAISPDSAGRKAADEAIECINCAVCYSACDVVGWNDDYTGPAALNRVWTLLNDSRQTNRGELLEKAFADGGCSSCHSHGNCTRHCPVEINPSQSIAGLKKSGLFGLPDTGFDSDSGNSNGAGSKPG